MGDSIEDVASFLVDSIAACHPDKHNGHGTKHDTSQFKKAYASAITQLLNTDYDTEYAHQVWLEKMYKKWGGHIPAAVLMPIEDQWRMIIPDFKGDAHVHNVREGALDHLPMPNEENSVAHQLVITGQSLKRRSKLWQGNHRHSITHQEL